MSDKGLHKDIENWAVLLGGGVSLLVICNIVLLVVVCLLISGCGTSRKVERMQERQMRAEIGMVEEMPDRVGHDGEGKNWMGWIFDQLGGDYERMSSKFRSGG